MTTDNVIRIDALSESNAKKILKDIIKDSSSVKFSRHALERMNERKITRRQVFNILQRGTFTEAPHRGINGNWKMTMRGISAGTEVSVACALENDGCGNYAVIITVYIN